MRAWNWQSESPSKYEVGEASWKKRVCRTQRSRTSRGKPGLGQKESRAGGTWLISEGNRGEKPSHDRVHARSQSSAIKTAAEKAPAPAPECPPAFLLPSCGLGPGPFTASCLAEPHCPLATPTLRLTRLPGHSPLTYPACESAPRCSPALEETDRAEVTYAVGQQSRMARGPGELRG